MGVFRPMDWVIERTSMRVWVASGVEGGDPGGVRETIRGMGW